MKPSPMTCDIHDPACFAAAEGLHYVTGKEKGFTRVRKGRKFEYYDTKGELITDEKILLRIRKLAIPPAYTRVWISAHANSHIQATGHDSRGRKQYRYHADWRNVRDASKFQHILKFGEALPTIRTTTAAHMRKHGLPREKVLATVVSLLDKTMIRIGNSEYAKSNQSYGLTTLREKHVDITGDNIHFRFIGKSGKEWNLSLSDRRIARTLAQCEEIPGQLLFKYMDENNNVHHVTSGDVNAYLKEITGEDFTAKDYRTWSGTVLAAMALQEYANYDSEAEAKRNVVTAIERVAKKLGNTPAICRRCYIHPDIVSAYMDGTLIKQITHEIDDALKQRYGSLTDEEILVLAFLKKRLDTH
jgi:DNA topoisomerase-1